MSTVLFITQTDLKRKTYINGNIDADKILPYIKLSQDIYIENYLGTDLFDKIELLISGGTINDPGNVNYKYLLDSYIKPTTIHSALVEYLPNAAYKITNQGIYKHLPENAETVDKNDVDFLIEKQRNLANVYAKRMIDYLCFNGGLFPEYYTNSNNNIYPNDDSLKSSWLL
tara:strand:- start:9104 stop:9616 length:513 start_codon:yes stop_codon:yes gene_type:complete